jgi:8-oxo-dGTP pyrophosphatase MutT (NUDIX family)
VEKPGEQHAFRVAAIRELFEETALLLASDARPSAATPPPATRRCALRADAALHAREGRRLREDASAFWRLCEEQRVAPHSLQLLPWSRWITPEQEPKRYDTWFYLAPLDAATPPEARVDGEEAVASAWLTPAEALALARAQKLELSPPTHYVLEELRRFSSLDALLWAARARPLAPIQPRLLVEDGAAVVALPGDPAHPGGSRLRRHRLVLDTETRVWHLHDAAAPAPPQPQEQEQDAGDRPRSPAHGKPASRL